MFMFEINKFYYKILILLISYQIKVEKKNGYKKLGSSRKLLIKRILHNLNFVSITVNSKKNRQKIDF